MSKLSKQKKKTKWGVKLQQEREPETLLMVIFIFVAVLSTFSFSGTGFVIAPATATGPELSQLYCNTLGSCPSAGSGNMIRPPVLPSLCMWQEVASQSNINCALHNQPRQYDSSLWCSSWAVANGHKRRMWISLLIRTNSCTISGQYPRTHINTDGQWQKKTTKRVSVSIQEAAWSLIKACIIVCSHDIDPHLSLISLTQAIIIIHQIATRSHLGNLSLSPPPPSHHPPRIAPSAVGE